MGAHLGGGPRPVGSGPPRQCGCLGTAPTNSYDSWCPRERTRLHRSDGPGHQRRCRSAEAAGHTQAARTVPARQRVAKCAVLLDADLDDPDVRMELWFALRHL
jgi:hypothetical protein